MTRNHAKIALLVISGLILILFIVGIALPREYKVDASVTINKPQAEVLDSLMNLRTWYAWSPWNKETDPNIQFTYSGPEQGAGSTFRWRGESVGTGGLTITQSHPDKGLQYELDRGDQKDMQYGNISFSNATASSTTVTWTVSGRLPSNPLVRWAGLFADAIGTSTYQQSLDKLKARLED